MSNIDDNIEFIKACKNGDIEAFVRLLDDIDVNFKDGINGTPLIYASIHNQIEIVRLLIEGNANVENKNIFGDTALIFASVLDNKKIVELLVDNGAKLESKNNRGFTALMCSIEHCKKEVAIYLLKNGANIDNIDLKGETALNYMCKNLSRSIPQNRHGVDMILFLHKNGADFFNENNEGFTPYDTLKVKLDLPKVLETLVVKLALEKLTSQREAFSQGL